ncbi:MAG: chemotaxis protein CheW [Deltaproteobacteria bacterium]|nr:chemotaxis protein CheW [Deltaproteobacteria bacterium]
MSEAVPAVIENISDQTVQYITFGVGEELFGVDIMCVEEIIIPKKTTVIPRTPKYFKGIINLRGEVISIIDLNSRFGGEGHQDTEDSRVIVIKNHNLKLGILVDKIKMIANINRKDIRTASRFVATEKQGFIQGSYQMPDDEILLLLKQQSIVDEDDFFIHQEIQITAKDAQSQEVEQIEDKIPEIFLVGFSLQEEQFAIESLMVEEIILLPEITPVPEMDDFAEGIFHLREAAIPIVRLGERLGLKKKEVSKGNLVIIIRVQKVKVGLIVDQVKEVYLIKENEIMPPPVNVSVKQQEQIRGVFKLERGGKQNIVMLLKLEKLFSFEEHGLLKDYEVDEVKEAKELELKRIKEEEVPILEFVLAEERYAIPVMMTNEIIPIREIVPIPKAPAYIKGVINLRGDVISIVDLPLLVEHQSDDFDPELAKFLIVNTGKEVAGLIVERVIGIRKVLMSSFEPPSDLLSQKGNVFIKGMGKDDKTGEIVVLMDLERTLSQAQDPVYLQEDLEETIKELKMLELEDGQGSPESE